MNPVSTMVSAEIDVGRDWFFYWFTAIDLTRVMHKYGPLPGVVGVKDQTGPMHLPGSSRVLLLSDGTTATEQVISCDSPRQVDYRLYQLTGLFRRFVDEAGGQIRFSETPAAGTRVEWRYSFFGRNWATTLVLKMLIPVFWRGFMRSALARSLQLAEEEGTNSQG
jgi:hypothetical protein